MVHIINEEKTYNKANICCLLVTYVDFSLVAQHSSFLISISRRYKAPAVVNTLTCTSRGGATDCDQEEEEEEEEEIRVNLGSKNAQKNWNEVQRGAHYSKQQVHAQWPEK